MSHIWVLALSSFTPMFAPTSVGTFSGHGHRNWAPSWTKVVSMSASGMSWPYASTHIAVLAASVRPVSAAHRPNICSHQSSPIISSALPGGGPAA